MEKLRHILLIAPIFLLTVIAGCGNDDENVEPPTFFLPEISLSDSEGEFGVGQIIIIQAEMQASALLDRVLVTNSGTELASEAFTDTGFGDYRFEYTVPAAWLGTTQDIVFTVTDQRGETASATYSATISAITPEYTFADTTINNETFRKLSGNVNFDESLSADQPWVIDSEVTVDQQTVLTIEAGAVIYGATEEAVLTVNPGGELDAAGTVDDPIIFTSLKAAPGQNEEPQAGDWVGLNIIGDATESDNSGTYTYLRVEYGGNGEEPFRVTDVGNETIMDHIQVHKSADTGFRIRGGTVNISHLIVTDPADRGVRYGGSWQGNGQFWVVLTANDSRAINGRDDGDPVPSNPTLSNITLIGRNITVGDQTDGEGVRNRDGANGQFYNTVVTGFATSFRKRDGGELTIRNCAVFNNDDNGDDDGLHSSTRDQYREPENNNSEEAIEITDTFVGVSMLNSVDASTLGSFFEAVNYVGAVPADNDWTLGWTLNFDGTSR